MALKYDKIFRLHAIGNSGVGKTCLIMRFVDDIYTSVFSTIGIDFKIKYVKLGSEVIKMQIWDTIGQRRFGSTPTMYYRGVDGFLVAFDVTDAESFNAVDNWVINIEKFSNKIDHYVILVGTKCDLEGRRVIDFEMAKQKADKFGIEYMETSSKLSINVEEVFIKIVTEIQHVINKKIPGN